MKIVITMAGEGKRFKDAGYTMPKYEIVVEGRTLFEWSLLSLKKFFNHEFIFVGRKDFGFEPFVTTMCSQLGINNFSFFSLDKLTSGQAETLYEAIKEISEDDSILVHNIDTVIHNRAIYPERINSKYWWVTSDLEGNHWSFAKMDKESKLILTSEKKKISLYASVGIYYFHSLIEYKGIFMKHKEEVQKDWKETYIAPFYNYIDRNEFDVLHLSKEYVCGLGTPNEVKENAHKLPTFFNYEEVSMVVSQFNGWQYIPRIVELFNNQIGDFNKKLIIINNGSIEKPDYDISNYINNNIILVNKDYGNIGFGRQVAIDNGLGEYVAIVDIDDEFDNNYLNEMYIAAQTKNADVVNCTKVNYDFSKKIVVSTEHMSKNGKWITMASYPHNRLIKRELLKGIIVDKMTNIDDMSFIPIVFARSKRITEAKTNYYWRTNLAESQSRGLSASTVILFFKKAMQNLLPYEKNSYVKFLISLNLVTIERYEPGYIKRSPFKLRFFKPRNWKMFYINLCTLMYKLGLFQLKCRIKRRFVD